MPSDVENHVYCILDQIHKKEDLDQISYDISVLSEFFNYKNVNENLNEEYEAKKQLISKKVNIIQSSILRRYLQALIESDSMLFFEPGRFKLFVADFEEKSQKIQFIDLTTSVELTPEDIHNLSEKMSHRMQCWVKVDVTVDKTLIGGVVIKNDNFILDYSLKTRLANFSAEWKKSLDQTREAHA